MSRLFLGRLLLRGYAGSSILALATAFGLLYSTKLQNAHGRGTKK